MHSWRISLFAIGLLASLLMLSFCLNAAEEKAGPASDEGPGDKADAAKTGIAATVNGNPITWAEVDRIHRMMGGKAPKEAILERLIQRRAVRDYLDEKGFEVDQKLIDEEMKKIEESLVKSGRSLEELLKSLQITEEEFREQTAPSIRLGKYLEKTITDEEVIESMGQVRASHILLLVDDKNSEEEAKKRVEEIEKELRSAKDLKAAFAETARKESQGPSGKTSDGDLGLFNRFMMVKPFSDVAFNLEIGQMSTPVRTQFGYHLIYVTERKPFTRKEYEERKDSIRRGYTGLRMRMFPMEVVAEADVVRYDEEEKPVSEDAPEPEGEDTGKDPAEKDKEKSPGSAEE